MQFHDLYSEKDTQQDWFFSLSGFEAVSIEFQNQHPYITEEICITNNGLHFHNAALLMANMNYYLVRFTVTIIKGGYFSQYLCKVTGMKLLHHVFSEMQEGKSSVDAHFSRLTQ